MTARDVVVCSFYTPDEYYAGHARELEAQLDKLGIPYELLEVAKRPGEDWADVTRRKIGFIHDVCQKFPDSMVFWIDVDCRITDLPDYVRNSTADLIGFQRSFRSPLHIGYHNRTRFWEPSFWGVNATPLGRKLVADAVELERRSDIKATDDYFLEEAWRANARNLTFQMIPATAIVRPRKIDEPDRRESWFVFGSSGNVADFKNKVVQHAGKKNVSTRKKLLQQVKKVEAALPDGARKPLRRLMDGIGVTDVLTADSTKSLDPQRQRAVNGMLTAGMTGDAAAFEEFRREFDNKYIAAHGETVIRDAGEAFLEYATRGSDSTIRLAWWSKPFPGNFGDWLSPLAVAHYTDANILLKSVTKPSRKPHLISLGSIGRFILPSSIVVGTGISRDDIQLAPRATYVSVRGPITARVVKESGGPDVTGFGDPGLLMSRLLPVERATTNGRIAFVRHFSHRQIPVQLPDNVDEFSVLMGRRADIEQFCRTLNEYDAILTSAMHVMIVAQSYGIPCGLVTFEGYEENVHGNGVKYEDYALGAGVEVMNPQVVGLDLRRSDLSALIRDIRVSDATKDEVEAHLRTATAMVLDALGGRKQR